jgi:PST family polysaccharide transporter
MASPADSPPRDDQSLDQSALSGVAWASAAKLSTQVLAWASTIIVARILNPSDFGLMTMATVFLGVVMMLSEFGVGSAVVTLRELAPEKLYQLNSISLLLGLGGTLVTVLMAYPLGLFFRAPELPPVLMVVGLTFLISSFQIVPAAMLRRELRFRTLALIDIGRGLLMPTVTLIGALLGLRYWALALGTVAGAVATMVFTLYCRRIAFARPRLTGLREVLHFSRDVLVSRLAYIIYQDGDFAVAGRRLGQAAVGDYSLAWTLATSPIEKLTLVLSDVTPGLFSAVQNDRPALRRYFLNLSEILCIATFPAAVGLALVSIDLVAVVLGPKWVGAGPPLALLALYAGARSVTGLFGHLFIATRETRFMMWISITGAVCLLTGFIVGSNWGTAGIAAAWLLIHPSISVCAFTRVRRVLDLSGIQYLKALRLGLDGSAAMALAVLAFQTFLASTWSPGLRLIASMLVGAAVFGLTSWLLHRARLREILDWLTRVRRGGTPAAEPA